MCISREDSKCFKKKSFDYRSEIILEEIAIVKLTKKLVLSTMLPHIFHTSNIKVWKYINKFTEFNNYRHQVLSSIKENLSNAN